MFETLFASKNQKLVKEWKKEHSQIVDLAHEITHAYSQRSHKALKKALLELKKVSMVHLMTENIEFYRLLKDEKRRNDELEHLIDEFTKSFREVKSVLRDFLLEYSSPDAVYDDNFFKTFNAIVGALDDRIGFEEENLYAVLSKK